MPEPDDDMRKDERLTAEELARWALFGDPYKPRVIPSTLKDLHFRVKRSIELAVKAGLGSGE